MQLPIYFSALALRNPDDSPARLTAGKSNAIRMPMMAITTSSSTRVKPIRRSLTGIRYSVVLFVLADLENSGSIAFHSAHKTYS